jgi:hypothetical protein
MTSSDFYELHFFEAYELVKFPVGRLPALRTTPEPGWSGLFAKVHSLRDRLCVVVARVPGYISRDPGFDSRDYHFLRSSGSGTGSTQPCEDN